MRTGYQNPGQGDQNPDQGDQPPSPDGRELNRRQRKRLRNKLNRRQRKEQARRDEQGADKRPSLVSQTQLLIERERGAQPAYSYPPAGHGYPPPAYHYQPPAYSYPPPTYSNPFFYQGPHMHQAPFSERRALEEIKAPQDREPDDDDVEILGTRPSQLLLPNTIAQV